MSYLSAVLKAAIQATADAVGLLHAASLGSTGSKIKYPTGDSVPQYQFDTGGAWESSPSVVQYIVDAIGTEADTYHIAWGYVSTSSTGVGPILGAGRGVSSVSKNETTDVLTINLSTSYTTNQYAAFGIVDGASPFICAVTAKSSGAFDLRFFDSGGTPVSINDRTVCLFSVGQV